MVSSSKYSWKVFAIVFVCFILAVLPWTLNPFRLRVFTLGGIYAIATTGLTLFMGFTGQISIGQAAFFGIGAYTSAILSKAGVPFVFAFFSSGLVAALCGLIVGFPCLRARTFYLAMATLAFGLCMTIIFKNWTDLTGGVSGLGGIPPAGVGFFVFESITSYYYLVWIITAAVLSLLYRLTQSYFGLALRAIGENEMAAESLSVKAYLFRLISFLICSFLAGIAGSLYAHLDRMVAPETFTSEESIIFLSMAVIGGLKSIYGGLIGAIIFTLIGEQLRSLERGQVIVVGALLVFLVIFLPRGLVSFPEKMQGILVRLRGKISADRSTQV
jgi:branched-chain amino acid transport system permease protein